jgi:uncharacterized membrane protein YdbT with pleckstrin-like domain
MVVDTVRRHPIVLADAFGIWFLATAGILILATRPGMGNDVHGLAFVLFLLVSLYFVGKISEWWIDEYVITNKRVIKIEGIVTRRISTIPIGKITDTSYRRTWLGRLLKYGDMVLDTPGQDKYLPMLNKLSRPDEVYKIIMSIAIGGGPVPAQQPRPPRIRRRKPAAEETATMPAVNK